MEPRLCTLLAVTVLWHDCVCSRASSQRSRRILYLRPVHFPIIQMGDVTALSFDRERYVALLAKLIGEAKHLQNNPPDYIPKEDRGESLLDR